MRFEHIVDFQMPEQSLAHPDGLSDIMICFQIGLFVLCSFCSYELLLELFNIFHIYFAHFFLVCFVLLCDVFM